MGNPHRETAVRALVEAEWQAAADAFTLAAHRDFGDGEEWSTLSPGSRERPAFGLASLCQAALCYRLAGHEDRARLRSLTAQPVAIDGRDHTREGVTRAVYQEFVADARAILGNTERAATEDDCTRHAGRRSTTRPTGARSVGRLISTGSPARRSACTVRSGSASGNRGHRLPSAASKTRCARS